MWMIALFLSLTFYAALECSGENLRNSDTSKSLRKESNHLHVFRHSSKQLSSRSDLVKTVRVEQDYIHEVMFAIKQKNMDKLTDILHDVSDPQSPNYGQHWTREEVANLTSNPEAHDALISYLHSNGASVLSESLAGEYIKVKAPVRVWEKMFNTKFFLFDKTHLGKIIGSVVRSEELWIPKELDIHIACVLNTIDLPFRSTQRPSVKKLSPPSIKEYESKGSLATKDYSWAVSYDGYITPYKIRKFYNMSLSTTGSSKSTQAIYSTYDEYFSPKNLFSFQQEYMSLSITSMNKSYGDSSNDAYCSQYELCVEGSLDSQYLMGTSPLSPTIFWWTNNFFDDFLYEVSSSTNVPLIISISWGISEQYLYSDVFDTFNTQAIKLGTMGTTIFVSSGDSGSNSYYCGYDVSFPASSPYVTSIGGTSVSLPKKLSRRVVMKNVRNIMNNLSIFIFEFTLLHNITDYLISFYYFLCYTSLLFSFIVYILFYSLYYILFPGLNFLLFYFDFFYYILISFTYFLISLYRVQKMIILWKKLHHLQTQLEHSRPVEDSHLIILLLHFKKKLWQIIFYGRIQREIYHIRVLE